MAMHSGAYGEPVYMSPYGTMPFATTEGAPNPSPLVMPPSPVIMLAPPLVPPPSSSVAASALGHVGPVHVPSSMTAMVLSHGNPHSYVDHN
jgi:hypothetical protein